MERMVKIDYVCSEVLHTCHDEPRKHFEPQIKAT
jgi:hypothetical protein